MPANGGRADFVAQGPQLSFGPKAVMVRGGRPTQEAAQAPSRGRRRAGYRLGGPITVDQ